MLAVVRKSSAEDFFDLKGSYYSEENGRVQVWSPSWLWQSELTPNTTIKIQGVYDVISGASPTGEPLRRRTRDKVITLQSNSTSSVTSFQTVSGASGTGGFTVSNTQQVTTSKKTTQVIQVPYGKPFLPMTEFSDERLAWSGELEHRSGDWLQTASLFYGEEQDYISRAASLKLGREFNNKNTLLSLAASFTSDEVLALSGREWKDREAIESILSISQVINKKTLAQAGYTFGHGSGFLNDQYKVVALDDTVVPEHRPDSRDKHVLFLSLSRFSDLLNGAAELDYRFYTDTYGVEAHTVEFAWRQKIGKHVTVIPSVRYYEQTAADFYAVQFSGNPTNYSADYRLSKLSSLSMGIKVVVKISDKFTFDAAYDRYTMQGRDGQTSGLAYPDANIVTVGFKLWY